MAITIRQVLSAYGQSDNYTHTRNLEGAVSSGEVLVLANGNSSYDQGGNYVNHITSIDSTGGGTWTQDVYENGVTEQNAGTLEIWSCQVTQDVASGTGITLHSPDPGHISPTWCVFALGNMGSVPNQADRRDNQANSESNYTQSPSSPSMTPNVDNCILIGAHKAKPSAGNSPFWAASSPWTELIDYAGPAGTGYTESGTALVVQYEIQTTKTARSSSGTSSLGSLDFSNVIISYKTGGGPITKAGLGIVGP